MKKYLYFLILINFLLGADKEIYEPNSKNFRDGFEAGLKAVELQANVDGFQQKLILLKQPYLLVYDIAQTPLHEALFLQVITAREGFDTHFTREFISLGEYEREIDAKDAKDLLVRKYKIIGSNIKILKNKQQIITYPFLYQGFYKELIRQAEQMGFVIKTEVIIDKKQQVIKPKVVQQTPKPKKIDIKKIVLIKSKAMSYTLNGRENLSTSYVENGLVDITEYEFDRLIVTKEGENFAKVKDRNLYFAMSDIKIKTKTEASASSINQKE